MIFATKVKSQFTSYTSALWWLFHRNTDLTTGKKLEYLHSPQPQNEFRIKRVISRESQLWRSSLNAKGKIHVDTKLRINSGQVFVALSHHRRYSHMIAMHSPFAWIRKEPNKNKKKKKTESSALHIECLQFTLSGDRTQMWNRRLECLALTLELLQLVCVNRL